MRRTASVDDSRRGSADDAERKARLGAVYDGYHDPTYAQRWSTGNPGNATNASALDDAIVGLLRGWRRPGPPLLLLDLGSGGTPQLPASLERMIEVGGTRIGADLLHERLVIGRNLGSPALPVAADGSRLPIASASVDLVLLFTLLSSVVDPIVQQAIANEVKRVVRPGGAVLCYDMRLPSPRNRNVTPLPRKRLAELFAGLRPTWRSTTLLPPVARRLGATTPVVFGPLLRLPFLRSHILGLLVKPED